MGGFNIVKFFFVKLIHKSLIEALVRDFNYCINACGINKFKTVGVEMTMSNCYSTKGNIPGRLDRA